MLLRESLNQSSHNLRFLTELEQYWHDSPGNVLAKLENFPKYVSREALTKFLARTAIFSKQLGIHGSVVELGVGRGASLFTWAHLSSIFEPANYTREIIGFDTFSGIPSLSDEDRRSDRTSDEVRIGGFATEAGMGDDIELAARIHDKTRFLGHIPKIRLVAGDIEDSLPGFLKLNQHLIISLLHIDVDVYSPTKIGLDLLLPRIAKGGIIAFDEINNRAFPGETIAVNEVLGIETLLLQRFDFCPAVCYTVR